MHNFGVRVPQREASGGFGLDGGRSEPEPGVEQGVVGGHVHMVTRRPLHQAQQRDQSSCDVSPQHLSRLLSPHHLSGTSRKRFTTPLKQTLRTCAEASAIAADDVSGEFEEETFVVRVAGPGECLAALDPRRLSQLAYAVANRFKALRNCQPVAHPEHLPRFSFPP
jgi:hypothetical protein